MVGAVLTAFADGRIFGEQNSLGTPTILAMHGWRSEHSSMRNVIADKAAISIDLPGFGRTPGPEEVWGARDYAKAVLPMLDYFDKPAVIVGHSFGGRVAVCLAAMAPERVGGLLLTGAPLVRRTATKSPSVAYRAVRFANKVGIYSDERLERRKRRSGSADYRAAEGNMRNVFVKVVNESYEDELRSLSCPVEMVWGENDTEAPLDLARKAASYVSKVRFTVVDGGSHWLPAERPAELREALERLES
jgi:pimeloyl-ACP methyl ester carboxylesterase